MATADTPLELGFELTSRCNRDCRHCFRQTPDAPQDMPLDLFERILEQAKALRVEHIAFSGGEPTQHPDFASILEATVRHGYTYHLVTNGHRFPETFRIMEEAGLEHATGVSTSLDGATEATHDSIRGTGAFRDAMAVIATCKTAGPPFTVQMTMHRANAHELRDMALLSAELGANCAFFTHLQPTRRMVEADLVPTTRERLEYERIVERTAQLLNTPVHLSIGHSSRNPLHPCRALVMRQLNIDCHGYLTLCCQLSNVGGGSSPAPDVICSLAETSLAEACRLLSARIADVQAARVSYAEEQLGPDEPYFPCEWCLRHFGKWVEAEEPE